MSMFEHHSVIMNQVAKTDPNRLRDAAVELYKDGLERLKKASPYELAEELRNPSSELMAVRDATANEALARMLLAWTT
jgi:hypothetical protein